MKECPICESMDLEYCQSTEDREGIPVAVVCTKCGTVGPYIYIQDSIFLSMPYDLVIEYIAEKSGWNCRSKKEFNSLEN